MRVAEARPKVEQFLCHKTRSQHTTNITAVGNGSRGQSSKESAPEQPPGCMLAPEFHTVSLAPAKWGNPVSKAPISPYCCITHLGRVGCSCCYWTPLGEGQGISFCSNCILFPQEAQAENWGALIGKQISWQIWGAELSWAVTLQGQQDHVGLYPWCSQWAHENSVLLSLLAPISTPYTVATQPKPRDLPGWLLSFPRSLRCAHNKRHLCSLALLWHGCSIGSSGFSVPLWA